MSSLSTIAILAIPSVAALGVGVFFARRQYGMLAAAIFLTSMLGVVWASVLYTNAAIAGYRFNGDPSCRSSAASGACRYVVAIGTVQPILKGKYDPKRGMLRVVLDMGHASEELIVYRQVDGYIFPPVSAETRVPEKARVQYFDDKIVLVQLAHGTFVTNDNPYDRMQSANEVVIPCGLIALVTGLVQPLITTASTRRSRRRTL